MTNQELSAKIDALYDDGKYEEVVSIVENLPEKEQNYHLLFVLAAAYSDLSDLGDDDCNTYHHKAIKILQQIADQGAHDLKWLYLTGRTYFNANCEEYAIEYFEKINRIRQKDPEVADVIDITHFLNKCKEYLYERALAVIFINLESASKDKSIQLESIIDNKIVMVFPKYNIHITITISDMRRSGACLDFDITYCDNTKAHYRFEGYGHTYENGVTDALNSFITEVNNNIEKHCKK